MPEALLDDDDLQENSVRNVKQMQLDLKLVPCFYSQSTQESSSPGYRLEELGGRKKDALLSKAAVLKERLDEEELDSLFEVGKKEACGEGKQQPG